MQKNEVMKNNPRALQNFQLFILLRLINIIGFDYLYMVWYKLKSTKARTLIECVLQNGFLDSFFIAYVCLMIVCNDDYVIFVYIYAS